MRRIFGIFLRRRANDASATLMGRLRRDVRGNTLAIMAAALIPLCGMVGSGLDMARIYMTKTRLQHACDSGVLAGRKQMGAGSWGADDNATAERFFNATYGEGAYGSTGLTKAFAENAGRVTGTASVTLPMTLMRVLRIEPKPLTVTCDAEMKLPNTDVMFVLDTTGSMNCAAGNTSCTNNGGVPASGSKIEGLKTAVKCFYEVLAQLDTNASCSGTPSGGTSSAVQIRFGFVPYASNVNVGHLLRSDWFVSSSTYQTRQRNGTGTAWSDWQPRGANYQTPSCGSTPGPNYPTTSTIEYRNTQSTKVNSTYYYCAYDYRYKGPNWDYGKLAVNSSALKSGLGWASGFSFAQPINDDGSNRTIDWDGCIEERPNWGTATYAALPTTNDVSQRPNGNVNTMWRPALPDLIFYRNRYVINDSNDSLTNNSSTTANRYYNSPSYSCPTEARLLQEWPSAAAFDSYVDGLVASGNTYHDIGMLWGARLMWPNGILDGNIMGPNGTAYSPNAAASNGGQIQRHMIFMTDGDSTASPCDYNSNGVPWYDQRQTTNVGAASDCSTNRQELINQINNRLSALCTIVKNQGITLWVVSYGGGVNSATEKRLSDCASEPDSVAATHYFSASDPNKLQDTFAQIANSISQLRLTK